MEELEVIEKEEVAIEEWAASGKRPPKAKRYVIRVDKQRVVSPKGHITGAEILALVGKAPDTHKLYQHKHSHQPVLIGPNQVVDLTEPGVERFTTMPKDTTEGLEGGAQNVRRQFRFPEEDERYLEALGLPWETLNDNGSQWLLVHSWNIPPGYNRERASLALLVPPNYPDSQIDMVYVQPALSRLDGHAIGALCDHAIAGTNWQRWSRHRTAQNPWRPGQDDLASHLGLVDHWLRREFDKN